VDAIEAFLGNVQNLSVAMHSGEAQRSADGIAEADAAQAPGHREKPSLPRGYVALRNLISAKHKQSFIRDRNSDNAAHEQEKEQRGTVV
jgi:hypothetical protein